MEDANATKDRLRRQWLLATIFGGTSIVLLFWATLKKIVQHYGHPLDLPNLGVFSDLLNSLTFSLGSLVLIFSPLMFIYFTVQAYSLMPIDQKPRTMRMVKVFLFSYAWLAVPNIAKSLAEGIVILLLLTLMAYRSDILITALAKKSKPDRAEHARNIDTRP